MVDTTLLIEQLAQKLGTTSEYLWNILITQAGLQIYTALFNVIIFVILLILTYKYSKWYEKTDTSNDNVDIAAGLGFILLALASLVLCIVTILNIYEAVVATINPEYWALKEVLSIFKCR